MAFSGGFHPHPRISYANAAATGTASEAEYVEISVTARVDPDALRLALDSEHRGHAYYAAIAATTQDAELCALAGEFAAEEAQHVMELERIIASRTAA